MRYAPIKLTVAAAVILSSVSPAIAATKTTTLGVSATVADTCTVTAVAALAFATISNTAASTETTPGSIKVVCTSGNTVSLTLGSGGNAATGQRYMANTATGLLPYNLFSDATHDTGVDVNGELYNGTVTAATPVLVSVYGEIPAGDYEAGVYGDTIEVTLTYSI